jgi:dienelactone hydrolase
MDVMESGGEKVIAYGILTLPKDLDLSSGEKRPVVVCQHGLEGTPQDLIGEAKHAAYKAYATRLAERGFITFAPQNGYKYFDLFRMQQIKAQSIGKTLFSIIVPQHRQITDWLAAQPWVDPDKIAFYGLSYGGETAVRVPTILEGYALSICSGDFNQWTRKVAATDQPFTFMRTIEWEMPYWNL